MLIIRRSKIGTIPENASKCRSYCIPHSDLFIWPQLFSEAKYGVTVYEESSSAQLMTNGKGEYLPDPDLSEAERADLAGLFQKHQTEIQELIQAADELWGDVLR